MQTVVCATGRPHSLEVYFYSLQAYDSTTADKRTTSQKSWDKAQVELPMQRPSIAALKRSVSAQLGTVTAPWQTMCNNNLSCSR